MDPRHKYPRTPHLPWSPGATRDDRVLESVAHFTGRQVVISEKMDGENTTLYRDGLHARSTVPSRGGLSARIQSLQAGIGWRIPPGWRICGENLQYRHSIPYRDLPHFFLVFSVWDEGNTCLSWDETEKFCQDIGLKTVPVMERGPWSEERVRTLCLSELDLQLKEGCVVRVSDRFPYDGFSLAVAKFVRKEHVQTDQHWRHGPKEENHWGQ